MPLDEAVAYGLGVTVEELRAGAPEPELPPTADGGGGH
jgi:hypothetical protein